MVQEVLPVSQKGSSRSVTTGKVEKAAGSGMGVEVI
jgi:hypothetical protein